ncbi:ParA family partition ATPase [Candidatus Tisiphia endosymbiont of Beris chalybata]|uniref:ParA family partition ATPase n=1 Tax=Candidatus Tisiphia endosymbiont of Beris chalybata TaxID=3066262 RepID=UPI00312CC224
MKKTKVITVANQKGGCGKTTITMQLAGALGHDSLKILVVDADPQGTATRWASNAKEDDPFPAYIAGLSAAGMKVHQEVKKYMGQYDYIIIDCPPAVDSQISQSALLISDLVLIPIVPSPADLWAAVGIQELIERIKSVNDGLMARLVINMCQSNLNLTQEVLEVLHDFGIEMLKSRVCLRTVYRQAAALGKVVYGIKGAEKAIYEINNLKKEIITLLTV